jgi:ribosome-associated heat shock protein Hsp15
MTLVRIDKWLWAVRLYKTRSQAAEACKGGKIRIDGQHVKASREVKEGDTIEIHTAGITKKVKVLQAVKNRVGAKLVPDLMKDLTPPEELERLEMTRKVNFEKRDHGIGRPTKKERRIIEKLKGMGAD